MKNKHGVGVEPTKIRSAGERSAVVPPVHEKTWNAPDRI